MTKKAFLTISVGSQELGTLQLVLYDDDVPRTVSNFVGLIPRYKGCTFHRIIPRFMAQTGDYERGDGTGGESIFGKSFVDENFVHKHSKRGMLSCANNGPDTNGSQFFITFRSTPHLDGRHVVFGHVDMEAGNAAAVLDALENVRTGRDDAPVVPVTISDCGLSLEQTEEAADADEIELDVDSTNGGDLEHVQPRDDDIKLPEDEDDDSEDDGTQKSKSHALRNRLKKLKMRINQARQLNRQEVMREGERLGSAEGMAKEQKRQAIQDKRLRQEEWGSRNAKALEVAAAAGIDGKFIVQPAIESTTKSMRDAEKAEARRHSARDYHNPEGQYQNYERSLKSLPAHAALERQSIDSGGTFNPMVAGSTTDKEESDERKGARRLANELKRRIEKQAKRKREKLEFEATDVTSINKRNKLFNKKISRDYDEHTADIRKNLERGTAL